MFENVSMKPYKIGNSTTFGNSVTSKFLLQFENFHKLSHEPKCVLKKSISYSLGFDFVAERSEPCSEKKKSFVAHFQDGS